MRGRNATGGKRISGIVSTDCVHWEQMGIRGGGLCKIGEFNLPSHGVCNLVCQKRQPHGSDKITPGKIKHFAKTVATSRRVPESIRTARYEICGTCSYKKPAWFGGSCSLCNCRVSKDAGLWNLAAWTETGNRVLCKHPKRGDGTHGWPLKET